MSDTGRVVETGGQAFPVPERKEYCEGILIDRHQAQAGMTLRDYFAGQYMVSAGAWKGVDAEGRPITVDHVAAWAYQMADAMLRHRGAK